MSSPLTHAGRELEMSRRKVSQAIAGILSVATLILVAAGAMVTGTGSSLAVPDWPLAYGEFFPPMVGGILYEHGHRMIATSVGFITVILAVWLGFKESRRWVKVLGFLAVFMVIFQGILGGLTVIYQLPKPISVSHAFLAQMFFLTSLILFQVTSPGWERFFQRSDQVAPGNTKLWAGLSLIFLMLTLLAGATMRHNGAGMAIPDFPLHYGRVIPPLSSFPLVIHFLHRVGAYSVFILVGITFYKTWRAHRTEHALWGPSALMMVLAVAQVTLGAASVLTGLHVVLTTLHVANGAFLMGITAILLLRAKVMEPVS